MKYYVYRNFTVENLFKGLDADYSGYGDISEVPDNFQSYIWFYLPPVKMNQNELLKEIEDFKNKFQFLFQQIPSTKTFIALTLTSLFDIRYENGNYDMVKAIEAFNQFLVETSLKQPNLKVIKFSDFQNSLEQPLLDWKYYYISQSFVSPKHNSLFRAWFTKKLKAIDGNRKKCIVLDLDNTLWGGILGEDGIHGIQIGDTYPGIAFRDFQECILETAKHGVILAVCSKNNEEDVMELWSKHPFQLVKQNHISAHRINWQDKVTNIQEIAEELNIGLDSIVFIDDNPIERERVKQLLPMVAVPDFPDQPYLLPSFFRDIYNEYFQIHHLTNEDKSKTQQYVANSERNVFKKSFAGVDEYLQSLEMELDIMEADKFTVPRIAQMTQKTNQFNLTTKRYSESDLNEFINQSSKIYCLSVRDKFGDNGITVASIINMKGEHAHIDSFLLSCRILGRNIEMAFIDFLINLLYDIGIKTVTAQYIPTQKNRQAEFFYEKNGFSIFETDELGVKNYILNIQQKREIKIYYKFNLISRND